MYALSLQKEFIAQHYLIGGDWGAENELHSHQFRLEVILAGKQLDEHGYLLDLVKLEDQLENALDYFRDQTLNDLPEFAGLNPSIEHFSHILCRRLIEQNPDLGLSSIRVRLWETDNAWASYQQDL